jgi:hypothetical protein
LQLQVVIDASLPREQTDPVIALGDFVPSETTFVYKSDPEVLGDSALQQFYRDLIFGRPLPLKLVAREIGDIDEILILALFLDRRLAIHPNMAAVVFGCDLGRFGPAGLAHADRDLARLISFARNYLGDKEGRGDRIKTIVEWLRQYVLEGTLPSLPVESDPPRILDVGTNGFVLAEGLSGELVEGWTELYRLGYLRGLLFGPPSPGGRRAVLGARKSHLVALDLPKAASILNEAETAMGELPGWVGESLWLWGPEEGTLLLPSHVTEVLIRV